MRVPERPTRRVPLARLAALVASGAGAAACGGAQRSVARLDELYATREGGRGVYATHVSRDGLSSLWSGDPEELEDPISFALEHLTVLGEATRGDLDAFERGAALGVAAEMGRIDPSRVVRAHAYRAARGLWSAFGRGTQPFDERPVDDAGLGAELAPLFDLRDAPSDARPALVLGRLPELTRAAQALSTTRPDDPEIAHKLLVLACGSGRRVPEEEPTEELRAALEEAVAGLAGHVGFQRARADLERGRGAADPWGDAAAAAGRLLLAIDPVRGTEELGRVYGRTLDPLVRIAWLQALEETELRGTDVHPSLRGALVQELDHDDVAVAHWARRTLSRMVELGDDASPAQIRDRWLALGEWTGAAPRERLAPPR